MLSRGERFREARLALPEGEQAMYMVEEATGISSSMISNLENDDSTRDVGYSNLIPLAKHYKKSIDYLLGISELKELKDNTKVAIKTTGLNANAIAAVKKLCDNNRESAYVVNSFLEGYEFHVIVLYAVECMKLEDRWEKNGYKGTRTISDETKKIEEDGIYERTGADLRIIDSQDLIKVYRNDARNYADDFIKRLIEEQVQTLKRSWKEK